MNLESNIKKYGGGGAVWGGVVVFIVYGDIR